MSRRSLFTALAAAIAWACGARPVAKAYGKHGHTDHARYCYANRHKANPAGLARLHMKAASRGYVPPCNYAEALKAAIDYIEKWA